MIPLQAVYRRELMSYFSTPLAYVFIFVFLVLAGALTFYFGNFFEREQADMAPFFSFHPWLYLFLVPAVSMRIWAEERKSGTIELLLTLPVSRPAAVVAKFLAAWTFTGIALAATFPLWVTVNYLGEPDNGVILAGYLGSWLMAGAFLAIGVCMSALTSSQVVAFVLSAAACLVFVLAGYSLVLDAFKAWTGQTFIDVIASLSFLTHFNGISRGVLDLGDLLFFVSTIVAWLSIAIFIVEIKQSR